jgi:hypothetical protein
MRGNARKVFGHKVSPTRAREKIGQPPFRIAGQAHEDSAIARYRSRAAAIPAAAPIAGPDRNPHDQQPTAAEAVARGVAEQNKRGESHCRPLTI